MRGTLVRLRPIAREDLPRFVAWIADPEVRRFLSFYRPVSLDAEEHWLEGLSKAGNQEVFAIETLEGRHIGSVGLHDIHPRYRCAEAGIFIGEREYWNKGYGTDAMRLLLDFGFGQLNLHRIFLHVHAGNQRAIRSYDKCGFVREGLLRQAVYKDGEYQDVIVMAILKAEYRSIEGEA
ncbi:MAG: GNAT family N-acetyltransferase [Anaerolineae bacterium]|nr:GNAT family N-acetyltransferase [Anaerolineae bacterium]